jgi:hypothetical protein
MFIGCCAVEFHHTTVVEIALAQLKLATGCARLPLNGLIKQILIKETT